MLANKVKLTLEKTLSFTSIIIIGFLTAKYFGPELFGSYALIQSVIISLSFIVSFGLDNQTILFFNDNLSNNYLWVNRVLSYRLSFSVIYFILVNAIIYILDQDNFIAGIFFSLSLVFSASSIFYTHNIYSSNFKTNFHVILFSSAFGFIIKLLALFFIGDLLSISIAFFLESFLKSVMFLYYEKKNGYKFVFDLSNSKKLLLLSIPLILSGIVSDLYRTIDLLLLRHFDNEINLGIYSFISKYVLSFSIIISVFSSYILSGLQGNNKNNDNFIVHSFIISFYMLFIVVISLFLSTEFILSNFFSEYLPGLKVFYWLLPSLFFYLTGSIFTYLLILSEKSKYILINSIIGLTINFILNFILIPKFSIYGAAISTLISLFFSGFLIMFFYLETRKIGFKLILAIITPNKVFSSFKNFYENNRL
jgi:O-antigen/teichoic acid export membrane protein